MRAITALYDAVMASFLYFHFITLAIMELRLMAMKTICKGRKLLMKNRRNPLVLMVILALFCCGASALAETAQYPFTLTTYMDMEVTFDHTPQRVIAANACAGDELMALGLGDLIIATAYNNSPINPLYQAEYDQIPVAAETYLELETILALEPDFVYGRSSSFSEKRGTTHDALTGYGIMSLSSLESYTLGADLDVVYQDFYNLGRIFQVEDRAEEIISAMKAQVAAAEKAVKDQEAVRVFVYDMAQEGGAYTCGNNFTATLIRHAGGENIFSDLDATWATVSWEEVVERDPQVIVINDYGSTSLEQKISELKDNPALSTVSAIANDRIISVTLSEVFACSMTGNTVEKLARAFHPDCFE